MNNVVKYHSIPSTKTLFNSFIDDFLHRGIGNVVGNDGLWNHPAVNIIETNDVFQLEFAAPGFEKQDFSVNVEGNQLTVGAQHETKQDDTTERYTRREFQVASFKRTFTLPKTVNQDVVSAVYANGVLEVTLPKKEEAKPLVKTVEIKG